MKLTRNADHVKSNIENVCKQRGISNYYSRFSFSKVPINGQELHLSILNTPDPKGIILFTPGTNAYALLYGEYLIALAELGYKVVSYDPRSHGQSSGANGSYTIPELIDDLYELAHHFHHQDKLPVFLSGSSQGGIVSFYCAAKEEKIANEEQRSAIIKGLICHNIADLTADNATELTRFPLLSSVMKKWIIASAKWMPEFPVSMWMYLDLKIEPVRNMGNAWSIIQKDPLLVDFVCLKTMASLSNTPLAVPIDKIQTPLFLIQADNDTIFKTSYSKWVFDRLNCPKRMEVYAGLPHYMIVDYVPEFIGDVQEWLESQTHQLS